LSAEFAAIFAGQPFATIQLKMEPIEEPENKASAEQQSVSANHSQPLAAKTGIAPVWHSAILIMVVVAVSVLGMHRHPGGAGIDSTNRIRSYVQTVIFELVLLGWVAFGLRLRGLSLKSLLGKVSNSFRSIALDAGIALLFWIGSMMTLATVALMWFSIQTAITHKPIIETGHNGQPTISKPAEDEAARAVVHLVPRNAKEVAYWLLLCVVAGIAEETVFRGYFQSQFTAWARGAAWAGVLFSAMMFGAAHGYEGARAMFLLMAFGVLFSLLVLFRRNLRAAMFAHIWHDAFVGLMVAFLHSRHLL
jgi:membrane protease YdiL (CAAX protease family)